MRHAALLDAGARPFVVDFAGRKFLQGDRDGLGGIALDQGPRTLKQLTCTLGYGNDQGVAAVYSIAQNVEGRLVHHEKTPPFRKSAKKQSGSMRATRLRSARIMAIKSAAAVSSDSFKIQ